MEVIFEDTGTLDALQDVLSRLERDESVRSILVLAGDCNRWGDSPEWGREVLGSGGKPLIGGVFPQVNYLGRNFEQGTVIVGMRAPLECAHVERLSEEGEDPDQRIEESISEWSFEAPEGTIFVFVDGLSRGIGAFVQGLFDVFGLEENFIGGGAGSLDFQSRPCVFTNEGFFHDAAVFARLGTSAEIGVTHGWEPISDGLKVTSAERNVVRELDWRNAFEVYKSFVDEYSDQPLTRDNFFEVAKRFPLGMTKMRDETIVRDPLMVTEDGHLVCVGEVPERSFVRLLKGEPDKLIESASMAASEVGGIPSESGEPGHRLLIDCISRVLFLGERIEEELEAVSGGDRVFGAFTLGEIANSGTDFLEFYNKTTVLSSFRS